MADGYEIFQNVLNYKHQYDLAIHGRSDVFECQSGSRDFCAPGIVWLMIFMLPVILPFIVGIIRIIIGLALLIYFLSSAIIDENNEIDLDRHLYNFAAYLAPLIYWLPVF